MIEKAKTSLQSHPVRSKVIVIGFFSVIFIILIAAALNSRVSEENTAVNPTPAPVELIPGEDYVQGQINVKFNEGLTDQEINSLLEKYSARIESTVAGINVKIVEVPVGQEESIRMELKKEGIVEYADLDHVVHGTFVPNDTHFGLQYGLKNTGQVISGKPGKAGADLQIENAWDVTRGNGVIIAVLDSGIDLNHPDLAGKVVLQKAFITSSINDAYGHGTHTAGLVSAIASNSAGIAGACPDCKLMIGKVLNDDNAGNDSTVANGIIWAADNNAKVLSMSLGTYNDVGIFRDAIEYAWNKGSVMVAAAGNDNLTSKQYPAGYSNVISVAATDNNDKKAWFTNHGTWVMVAAAGENVISTLPTYQNRQGVINYGYLSGTSMATPMVAGVAGLVLAANPNFTNQQVVERIFETADPIEGTGTLWQKGRVNAARAVGATESANLTPTVTLGPTITATPGATISPTVTVPPFVCGGSPDNICTSPTVTIPPIDPGQDCLDPRGTTEKINDWVDRFILRVKNYIDAVMGNPQQPPPPPVPCVVR